jgi:hypothetical protein
VPAGVLAMHIHYLDALRGRKSQKNLRGGKIFRASPLCENRSLPQKYRGKTFSRMND